MVVFMFPGQGSQKRGMGQGLFDEVSEFASVERAVDDLLGYSVRMRCLEDSGSRLRETQFTQPCLYVVNALHYYNSLALGERPAFLAGHSVGEYNALLAAGAFDFLTGVRLVQKRGELMARATNGGMAAVVGLDPFRIAEIMEANGLDRLDVANFNAPLQTIVSGPTDEIQRAAPFFEGAGARAYLQLPVSAAFHSRYMANAAREFASTLASFQFNELRLPVISNVTGEAYPSGDPTGTIRSLLTQQITSSVQWTRSVRHLIDRGATSFREVGPGTVLTRLVEQIQDQLATAS
jgi:malonyl CoA-acyl carrier protein transacylase